MAVGNVLRVPAKKKKKKETFQKKEKRVSYLFLLVGSEKKIEKFLVRFKDHRTLCGCNLHRAQQIVLLMMPLTLVPPLYPASYYA